MGQVIHPFEPVYDKKSRVLIVGSMASVLSRKNGFYYGNPQNRFWRLLAMLFDADVPETVEQKKEFLLERHIALYDVLSRCEIKGSADASIQNAQANDFSPIFQSADIRRVFANGGTACGYYKKFVGPDIVCLPSTSPANAAWGMERLAGAWAVLPEALK